MKRYLLSLTFLWRAELIPTFTLQPTGQDGNKKRSYMGMIKTRHLLLPVSYLFPFYWYANVKGMPVNYKLLGSYDTSLLQGNAVTHSILLASTKRDAVQTPRPQPAARKPLPEEDSVGWRDLHERVGATC